MTRWKRSRIRYTPGLCGTSCTFLLKSGFSLVDNGIARGTANLSGKWTSGKSVLSGSRSAMTFDVAIVGGGPAGSTCATFCALAGLRVLVLDREVFPREKVCGDCLNPGGWAVLERLSLAAQVRALPHGQLDSVQFIAIGGQTISVD